MPYNTVIVFTAYSALAAADLNSNFANLDYLNNKINSQIFISAGAIKGSQVAGAAPAEIRTAVNTNEYLALDFADTGGSLYAQFSFVLPSDYNGGTITAKFYWTANSTSTNSVVWAIMAAAIADDGTIDVAYGTAQTVTDANKSTAYDLNISDATPAITIAGTPAAGKLVNFGIYRSSGDAADTLAATARLLAVVITYTRS